MSKQSRITLTEQQKHDVQFALAVARARFKEDAVDARKMAADKDASPTPAKRESWERLALQFDKQVQDTDALENLLIDADTITLNVEL